MKLCKTHTVQSLTISKEFSPNLNNVFFILLWEIISKCFAQKNQLNWVESQSKVDCLKLKARSYVRWGILLAVPLRETGPSILW